MHFPYKGFQIDTTPSMVYGKYCAQATISQEHFKPVPGSALAEKRG
jgi:hypothetical protein